MSIQEYLPEKNFFITIGGLVVAITIVLLVMAGIKYKNNKPQQEEAARSQNRLVTNEQALQNLQILERLDSDGDGLYDWEEALWGTNPLLADTDGDGVSDFDEVQQVKREYDLEENITPQEELTEIDLISRDLYSTIAVLDQQGKLGESAGQIENLFQQSVIASLPLQATSLSEVILVPQSNESKSAYARSLDSILGAYGLREEDFLFIMNSASSSTKSDESLGVIDKYMQFQSELGQMEVPVDIQNEHIEFLNSIKNLHQAMESMLYSDQNPLEGFSATIQSGNLLLNFDTTLTALLQALRI